MSNQMITQVVELIGPDRSNSDAFPQLAGPLRDLGWEVRRHADPATDTLHNLVFDPGLLEPPTAARTSAAVADLQAAVDAARERFPASGGRIVVIASRDYLGAPSRTAAAAAGGGLVSAVRSLALELGRAAITVNLVVGLPAGTGEDRSDLVGARAESLLPWHITEAELAATVAFLLDPRSSYITGQVLHCTGGASLLSSLTS
ncbi:SDR family oxidoreductase [Streptomyces sp. NPDC059916]|uniref:SDR family oxidoreductase n=1 Tax=Streptomyces sp. NPDC059916 TaxID=3347001 RepID=UPI0036A7729F